MVQLGLRRVPVLARHKQAATASKVGTFLLGNWLFRSDMSLLERNTDVCARCLNCVSVKVSVGLLSAVSYSG